MSNERSGGEPLHHQQDMGDLHDLYLETDVMLLADVFETL